MRRWAILIVVIGAIALASYAAWTRVQNARLGIWNTAYSQAYSLYYTLKYPEAAQKLAPVLAKTEEWWPNSPRLFETLYFLGGSYRAAHNYAAAEPLLKRALALGETLESPDSTEFARVKFNLAIIARDKPDDVEAERLFNEALDLFAKNPAAAQADDAASLLNLGALCITQGRYQEAESFLTRSVAAYQRFLGVAVHQDFANAYLQLAEVYRLEGRNLEATEQYRNALNMYEKIEGPNGLHVQRTLTRFAIVQSSQGNDAEASKLADRSQAIAQSLTVVGGKLDGTTLNDLGLDAEKRHELTRAEDLLTQACTAYEQGGSPESRHLATALTNLGNLYRDHQEFDIGKAEGPLKRALTLREQALGSDHPDVGESLSDLSLLYFYEKKAPAAKQFAQRALPIEEKVFGPESLEVSTTLNRLGIAERDMGNLAQAETDLKRALAIREKTAVPSRTWIAISLENLASVYWVAGEREKAAPLIARAQAIRTQLSRKSE